MKQLIVDTETTGLDGKPPGFQAEVVEIGLVAVDEDGGEIFSDGWFVRQPDVVLEDPRARHAFSLTGITPDVVRRDGISVTESQARLKLNVERALEEGVTVVRAFNQDFDFRMLNRNGFDLEVLGLPPGECIMLAAMELMGNMGALPPASAWIKSKYPDQRWKWPRLTEVVAFLSGRGYEIRWTQDHHRALSDAQLEASVAVALDSEISFFRSQMELPL